MNKFSNCKVFLVNGDSKVRARVSVLVADTMYVTGMRVVEGSKGLFISMNSYKDAKGEYHDIFFPANKEVRAELEKYVLDEYEKALG